MTTFTQYSLLCPLSRTAGSGRQAATSGASTTDGITSTAVTNVLWQNSKISNESLGEVATELLRLFESARDGVGAH